MGRRSCEDGGWVHKQRDAKVHLYPPGAPGRCGAVSFQSLPRERSPAEIFISDVWPSDRERMCFSCPTPPTACGTLLAATGRSSLLRAEVQERTNLASPCVTPLPRPYPALCPGPRLWAPVGVGDGGQLRTEGYLGPSPLPVGHWPWPSCPDGASGGSCPGCLPLQRPRPPRAGLLPHPDFPTSIQVLGNGAFIKLSSKNRIQGPFCFLLES